MGNRRLVGRGRDTGAATLDYVAVIVLISMVCAVVAVTIKPAEVSTAARAAVCRFLQVAGIDCADPVATGPTDEEYKPSACKIREQSELGGAEVKIAWFKMGEEYGFIRQEFSDGTVRLTLVDSASIGAVGSGKEKLFDIGKLGDAAKGGASVEVEGGLKFGYGSTWQFKDASQEKEFRGEIEKYAVQQLQYRQQGGGWVQVIDGITGNIADPPDPNITFSKASLGASLAASLGVKVPTGAPKDADGKLPTVDPSLGGSFTVQGDYEVLMEKNATAGTTSWSYQLTPQVKGSVNAGVYGAEGWAKSSGGFRVTRNDKNELVSLSFVSTREIGGNVSTGGKLPGAVGPVTGANGKDADGGSKATVTVTTLPLATAEDRRIAQDWLAGTTEQLSSPFNLTVDTMIPSEPDAGGDDFKQLLYQKALVSQTDYANVSDVQKFGAEVNFGFKLGFSFSLDNSSSTSTGSSYLGAPVAGGSRPMRDFSECY